MNTKILEKKKTVNEKTQKALLELFGAVYLGDSAKSTDTRLLKSHGIVTDFVMDEIQKKAIKTFYTPLKVTTLFTREERESASFEHLVTKQLLHYVEVYGFGMPGLFDLEVTTGKLYSMRAVLAFTKEEIQEKLLKFMYTNAPFKNVNSLKMLIDIFDVKFDVNKVANNELRILLFNENEHLFADGDDAVRYMVMKTTDSTMLIKSPEVLANVKTNAHAVNTSFLKNHKDVLSKVFNRHKRIILSLKSKKTRTIINKITRLSKTNHVPVREAINKTFVSKALAGEIEDVSSVLNKISVRDKFKYLNMLEYKKLQKSDDVVIVRNGKSHILNDRKIYNTKVIETVIEQVLQSLKKDLSFLKDETILLDKKVKYGLPTSRKQAVGQLPFGTVVQIGKDTKEISSGIYWRNEWGARDLDLTTIDLSGMRTGWGQASGFDGRHGVIYSGDMTYANPEAMEFMTSSSRNYGLFVNIYSGADGSKFELVVGKNSKSKRNWMDDLIIREKHTLESRGNLIGFVRGNEYVVYYSRLNNGYISSGDTKSMVAIEKGMIDFWTINKLFEALDINFDVKVKKEKTYTHDLTYENFSFDKLETMLYK